MKKIFSVLIISILIVSIFVGCSSNKEEVTTTASSTITVTANKNASDDEKYTQFAILLTIIYDVENSEDADSALNNISNYIKMNPNMKKSTYTEYTKTWVSEMKDRENDPASALKTGLDKVKDSANKSDTDYTKDSAYQDFIKGVEKAIK